MLSEGDVLGDCVILGPLGRGGMGEVYLARDRRLGRQVAVKVLPASVLNDASRLDRFEREARSASALNHPNICTIHALGELRDGRRFIVMEHVGGDTLRAVSRERPDLRRVVDIGRQLAEGLAAAHDAGVVHRDVKPENVMVRADGLVKILDFGLAKILPQSAMTDGEPTRSFDTSVAGAVVGTVRYMSPEQARGEPTDARTDIWAVGAVLYELVTGHAPFEGKTASDVIANVLHTEPVPLGRFEPTCPPELQRIVSKCLRKDRGHRYQTMRDVATDLEALGDTLRSGSGEAGPHEPAAAVHRAAGARRARWALAAAAVTLVIVAVTVAWQIDWKDAPDATAAGVRTDLALRRLTFDSGLQIDASFSPDGRFIAYAADRSGNFDIWVQAVDGGDAVQITREAAQDVQPAWSPSGDSIVFRSERNGGGLFVVPALGGHARQLSSFGSHPTWLNSSEILFLLGNPDAGVATIQLYVVGLDGEPPLEILRDVVDDGRLMWAAGHPDGRVSLMVHHHTRGLGLFTVSRDGRTRTTSHIPESLPIQRPSIDDAPFRFQWSPSGTALYLEATTNGVQNLWRVDVDPASLAWVSMRRLTTGPGRDVTASVSNDGRRLAYAVVTEQTRVYAQRLAPDGTTVLGPLSAITEADGETFTSALSHDARRLAYLSRQTGTARYQIRIADLDTGASELLDDDLTAVVALGWSPDDSAILHQRIRVAPGTLDQFQAQLVRHAPGSRETVLRSWSSTAFIPVEAAGPDEMLGIVATFSGTPSRIAVWSNLEDPPLKQQKLLFSDPKANLWESSYVPGRRWISFVREPLDQANRVEMMLAPAEGSAPAAWKRLLADHPWADKPRWSADGRLLYFLSPASGDHFNLWVVPFDPILGEPTGSAFQVTHYDSPARFISPQVGKIGVEVRAGVATLPLVSAIGSIWMLDGLEAGK